MVAVVVDPLQAPLGPSQRPPEQVVAHLRVPLQVQAVLLRAVPEPELPPLARPLRSS